MTLTSLSQADESAVAALVEARRTGRTLAALPGGGPADEDGAFATQMETLRRLGVGAGSWKVGMAPGRPASFSPIPADITLASPATLKRDTIAPLGVEAEIAFVFARDVNAAPGATLSPDEVADHIEGACAAIEIVATRFDDLKAQPRLAVLADLMSTGGLVVGATNAVWRDVDLATIPVRLLVNGVAVIDQRGGNPAAPPLISTTWLVNQLIARGAPPRAGQAITTGSYTGLTPVKAGDRVEAIFAGVGEVAMTFA